jgi:hypothetical protein
LKSLFKWIRAVSDVALGGVMSIKGGLLLWVFIVLSTSARALTFEAPIEETEWRLTPSIFECEFAQPIPNFGEAVFYHEAGEDLMFHLNVKKNLM